MLGMRPSTYGSAASPKALRKLPRQLPTCMGMQKEKRSSTRQQSCRTLYTLKLLSQLQTSSCTEGRARVESWNACCVALCWPSASPPKATHRHQMPSNKVAQAAADLRMYKRRDKGHGRHTSSSAGLLGRILECCVSMLYVQDLVNTRSSLKPVQHPLQRCRSCHHHSLRHIQHRSGNGPTSNTRYSIIPADR
jgi:hypothetical protein